MELSGLVSIDVEHRQSPPVALIRVSGELDFGTTPRLVAALSGSPGPGEHLVFDLTGLQFCDSSGLGALIAAHKLTEANGTTLYLTGVASTVRTAIEITSLDQLFEIREDVAAVYAEIESA